MFLQNKAQSCTTVVTNVRLMSVTRANRGASDPITSRDVLSSWFVGYTPSPGKVIPIPMGLLGWHRAILESGLVTLQDRINILHDVNIVEFDKGGRLSFNCSVDMINLPEGGFQITIVVKETNERYKVLLTNSQLKIEQRGEKEEVLYHHKLERYIGPAKANYWMDPISHLNTGVVLDKNGRTHTIPLTLTDRIPVDFETFEHVIMLHRRAVAPKVDFPELAVKRLMDILKSRKQQMEEVVVTNHSYFSMLVSMYSLAAEDVALSTHEPLNMTAARWIDAIDTYTELFADKLVK